MASNGVQSFTSYGAAGAETASATSFGYDTEKTFVDVESSDKSKSTCSTSSKKRIFIVVGVAAAILLLIAVIIVVAVVVGVCACGGSSSSNGGGNSGDDSSTTTTTTTSSNNNNHGGHTLSENQATCATNKRDNPSLCMCVDGQFSCLKGNNPCGTNAVLAANPCAGKTAGDPDVQW